MFSPNSSIRGTPPESLLLAVVVDNGSKFSASNVDTSGKKVTGVVDTGDVP
jgi:hypothetical protein